MAPAQFSGPVGFVQNSAVSVALRPGHPATPATRPRPPPGHPASRPHQAFPRLRLPHLHPGRGRKSLEAAFQELPPGETEVGRASFRPRALLPGRW